MTTQLYLITPPSIDSSFAALLKSTLEAGEVAALQLRLKDHSRAKILELAPELIQIAQDLQVAVILNDDPELAVELGCDGVHLGQEDGDVKQAREMLGKSGMLGVTCHDSRHLAMQAGERGADYVAFGAFFPTQTKQASTQAEIELITWWTEMFEIPCVAIGGITVENAKPIIEAKADFMAVCGGVWNYPAGSAEAVKAFNTLCSAK